MAPPPELNTDAVSEILLRLPPDDPAGLVRASAVCKPWFRTLTDPAFLRRYRAFHGTPRVLGFLQNGCESPFVPTTAFHPHASAAAHRSGTGYVLDCRHGRVLLYNGGFVVWEPVTGHERWIADDAPESDSYNNHAVLCSAGAGCDHSTCGGGPFIIACVGLRSSNCGEYYACFYSSETGEWSTRTIMCLPVYYSLDEWPPVLAGDALYFNARCFRSVLRYNVLAGRLVMMQLPPCNYRRAMVITVGNGGLGVASFDNDDMLVLWSAEVGPNGDARWSQIKLIDLQKMLPIDIGSAWLSGFAEDANVIFLSTADDEMFTIDLKSLLARKVCEMGDVDYVFPYVSFYTPAACARGALKSLVETAY